MQRFLDREPSHTLLTPPDSADMARRAVGDAMLGLDVEIVESPHVPLGQMYIIDRKALDPPPMSLLGWDHPDSDPLADTRAACRMATAAPWVYQPPILSPAAARLYQHATRQARFREELRRRWIADRRLRPMRLEYRRRMKRRGKR